MKANLNSYQGVKKTLTSETLNETKMDKQKAFQKSKIKDFLGKRLWLTAPLILTACNSDNKKILGLAGNAASEGIEKLFQENPSIATAYTISSTTPASSTGNGSNSLPIEVTGAVVASPVISGYPLLDFTFSAAGTVDFTNVTDVKNISISGSTAGVNLTNLTTSIEKIFVKETQSSDWTISFQPDNFGTLNFDWTNNSGTSVDLTSLTLNEAAQLTFKNSGNEAVTIPLLNLDPEDTQRIEIGNDNDGNIIIAAAANLTGTTALKTISLTTSDDGDIALGTPGTSGLPDLQKLNSIAIDASETGAITIGDLGSSTPIDNLSSIAMVTKGAPINIGSIKAKKINSIVASGTEFSSINIGNITIEEAITGFSLSGAGDISIGTFSGDGTVNINASDMSKKGISLNFSTLKGAVDITTTNQDDVVSLGIGAGKVISGAGDDTISIVANATGNADIRAGNGIDVITLSSLKGTDIVQPGGTSVSTIDGSATSHADIMADKVINFDPTSDKIGFGSTTSNASNFVSATGATSFSDALLKANSAMSSGKTYYFSYNVATATDGFGLMFYDSDGDGSSNTCISLVGITTNVITFEHLVIV